MRETYYMRRILWAASLALAMAVSTPALADGPADGTVEDMALAQGQSGTEETGISPTDAASGAAQAIVPAEQVPDYVPREKIPQGRFLYIPNGLETSTDGISTFRTLNDPQRGNEGYMRNYRSPGNPYATDWEALQPAMAEFTAKYGVDLYATAFEKEMAIIRGLMKECTYAEAEDLSTYTAYTCLVQHRAQCAGYADAFLQLVRYAMPGTDVRYIHSDWHAWNLICLDGDWYHVDLTWEDDDAANEIRNYFVNLEDDLIEAMGYHHWVREDSGQPAVAAAEGYRYGPMAVELYRLSGGTRVEPEPAAVTVNAGSVNGVLNGEDVFRQVLGAVSAAMAQNTRIIRVFVPNLDYSGSRDSLRGMMQEVTDTLHRQMMYVARPWYDFYGSTIHYRVTMTGTMIEIILPDQLF